MGVIVVPLRGVGLGGHFFGGGLPHGGAGLGLAVELGDVIALLAVRHIAGGTAGDVGPGLIDGGGLIVPLHGGPGELHQGLHQVQLAVVVGVVVGFHVDEEPDDVAVGVVIALFHRAGGEGEDGLGHAVHEQGLSGLAVEGIIEHLGGLLHHRQVGLGAGGRGAVILNAVGHAHAVGHGVVVSGVGAQLALLHPCPAEQVGHSLLVGDRLVRLPGDWEGQVRAVGSQLPQVTGALVSSLSTAMAGETKDSANASTRSKTVRLRFIGFLPSFSNFSSAPGPATPPHRPPQRISIHQYKPQKGKSQ